MCARSDCPPAYRRSTISNTATLVRGSPFPMSTIIQLAIVLGIMVLVHEFGHFAVAKLCGIRVEVFSIGFGKRLFGIKRGDTDYCLSIIPLGGYVQMAGA